MGVVDIIALATQFVNLARMAIQVGEDAAPHIENAYRILVKGETLTEAERAMALAEEARLRAILQEPLPEE